MIGGSSITNVFCAYRAGEVCGSVAVPLIVREPLTGFGTGLTWFTVRTPFSLRFLTMINRRSWRVKAAGTSEEGIEGGRKAAREIEQWCVTKRECLHGAKPNTPKPNGR